MYCEKKYTFWHFPHIFQFHVREPRPDAPRLVFDRVCDQHHVISDQKQQCSHLINSVWDSHIKCMIPARSWTINLSQVQEVVFMESIILRNLMTWHPERSWDLQMAWLSFPSFLLSLRLSSFFYPISFVSPSSMSLFLHPISSTDLKVLIGKIT